MHMKEYKIAICVPIKDETEYLKEWLDWHFGLGITDIYLYEDYNSVSHLDITNQYNNAYLDKISRVFSEEYPSNFQFTKKGAWKQSYLYHYFYNKYRDKYDWIMFIDVDEFLILKKPLQEILDEFKNNLAIKFKWRIMTANGHIKKPAGNVMDNYTEVYKKVFQYKYDCKSIINCRLNKSVKWEIYIHSIKGAVFPINEFGEHYGYINHYFTKSWEEYKFKLLSRGDICSGNRKIRDFFKINKDMCKIKNDLIREINMSHNCN